jgi:hypothetical protein
MYKSNNLSAADSDKLQYASPSESMDGLNRNSLTEPRAEEKGSSTSGSIISKVLAQMKFASVVNIPEEKILFSVSAHNMIELRLKQHVAEQYSAASVFLDDMPPVGFILNQANASKSCIVLMEVQGNVIPVCPHRVVDSLWQIGGIPVLLKLLENSFVSHGFLMHCRLD